MKIRILLISLLSVLLLTACNKPPEVLEPVKGGEIELGISSYIIDPLFSAKTEPSTNYLIPVVYRGLLKYNNKLQLTTDLAESFSIDEEKDQIEIILKNTLKWEDKTPITVEDVKYTYELYSNKSFNGYWKSFTLNIVGTDLYRKNKNDFVEGIIISPDARSITIQYKDLSAIDLEFLTAPILSKKQLSEYSSVSEIRGVSAEGKLLANGPFKVEKLYDSVLQLIRNDSFEEEVYLDRIVISNNQEKINYDLMLAVPSDVQDTNFASRNILKLEGQGYDYLGMNLNAPEFKDISIRKAISSVINNDELITSIYQGYADKPLSPIHPKSWAYIANEFTYYELKEAQSILKQKNLKLQLAYEDTLKYQMLAEKISNKLNESGIKIDLKPIPQSQFIPTLFSKGEFDLFLASWMYEEDPVAENEKWLAKNDVLQNGFNVSHVNDQTSDTLLINASTFTSEDKRAEYYKDWQKHFMEQYYVIPLASAQTVFMHKPELHVNITNSLVPYEDIQNWWEEKTKEDKD